MITWKWYWKAENFIEFSTKLQQMTMDRLVTIIVGLFSFFYILLFSGLNFFFLLFAVAKAHDSTTVTVREENQTK